MLVPFKQLNLEQWHHQQQEAYKRLQNIVNDLISSKLKKLKESDWNGAIFAAAGLGRLNLTPEDSVNLEWMVPAPAQGAIMIASLKSNTEALEACAPLNHEETEIATAIERRFLNKLEGGCSAPIGAIA